MKNFIKKTPVPTVMQHTRFICVSKGKTKESGSVTMAECLKATHREVRANTSLDGGNRSGFRVASNIARYLKKVMKKE